MSVEVLEAEAPNELRGSELEAVLLADAPSPEAPVPMSRQTARRMALQLMDQRLRAGGMPRAQRRTFLFRKPRGFNLTMLANSLTRLSDG